LGQVVAIKVLPPSRAKDPYLLSRFLREARLAVRLNHPHVVRSYQIGEANKLHYIVMEYLDGETLDDVLFRRRRLPVLEAVRVIYQTLKGLQHIQDMGMVHRDVKPSNLMLTPARVPGQPDATLHATVKILDIGLGRMFFDENAPITTEEQETQLTGDGVLLGTPDYLAPEQARNARGVDSRADIYSAGSVLYHCISGNPPFPDNNILNQIIRHAQETPRRLKEFNPDVPDALQQVIDTMMAKEAGQRYPTPELAAQALQPFLNAGMEVVQAAAPDMRLSQYLIWLEKGNQGGAAPAARPAARLPRSGKVDTDIKLKRKLKHKKRKLAQGVPVTPKPAPAGMDFDVELVSVSQGPHDTRRMGRPKVVVKDTGWISKRTLLLSIAVVVGLLLAVAVGGILASGGPMEFLQRLGIVAEK
jgi:serine/threonine protein kinase